MGMDIDQYLSLPSLPKSRIKLRIIVEANGVQYEKSIDGTQEHLKSFINKINSKAKKEEESIKRNMVLSTATSSTTNVLIAKNLSQLSLNHHIHARNQSKEALADPRIFGVSLDTLMERQKSDTTTKIPIFMKHALKHLFVHSLDVEGLFRISSSQADLVARKVSVDKGELQFSKDDNPHLVTGLLKIFLRELPEPICTADLYDLFLASSDQITKCQSFDMIKKTLSMLPPNNKQLFQHLCHFLTFVAANSHVNLMNHSNLGRIFGPNLFWKKEVGQLDMNQLQATSEKVNVLAENLITHYNDLFEEPTPTAFSGRLYLQSKMLGHKKSVQWLALIDQERKVCSLDTLGLLKVWDSQSATLINEFNVCEQGALIYSMVCASNDTIWVATSQSVSIWSPSGKMIGEAPGEAYSLTESQHGDIWVGGNQVMNIYSLKDIPTEAGDHPIKPIGTDLFNQNVFILALCKVGKNRIWGCSSNKLLYIYDAKTKEILHKTEIHEKRPKRIAYIEFEDYEAVWIGGDEGTFQILNANTYELVHKIENAGWDKIFVLAPIGREMWTSTWDIVVRSWEPRTRDVTGEIKGNHSDAISAILEVPNLKGTGDPFIWFGSFDKSISTYINKGAADRESKWSNAKRSVPRTVRIGFSSRG
ncbi:RhoGAP domain-containing protein [Heterostelium album PN500]|uniref:RhoGAP domain-containing protein n=1 Tax=Heterostelium pallidum (strain ATCC 26659 / Pp 5 / PN500) TaxID=670386 RepID=D3B152_HETP5|nr:RhoGAP domain-containing protein [Heterostelium album PN500]EFA85026.1 RhoGAP domain-containing protein [Heterostelium album PN500]|eukprot:XP_020437136.1 RhoGAP domain-containing protein [Heterostelium album PN500]